jgi:hypothetical protein
LSPSKFFINFILFISWQKQVKEEGAFKVQPRKMKQLAETPKTIKVDLSKKPEEQSKTSDTIKVVLLKNKKKKMPFKGVKQMRNVVVENPKTRQ